jgi:hypothetical protein
MKIRSAQDLLKIVEERGLKVEIQPGPPIMPVLRSSRNRTKDQATQALLGALRAFRAEIIELLNKDDTKKIFPVEQELSNGQHPGKEESPTTT